MNKEFFEEQKDITAAKIKIYKEYITGYLPKILNTYSSCLVADWFCGSGKNGNEDGSPLVLLKQAKYILESPVLKGKNTSIDILFNDVEPGNIKDLESQLSRVTHPSINLYFKSLNFSNILTELLPILEKQFFPKFFFLDPFTYSNITTDDLKKLINLDNSEVFLFIPVFHSYRFANQTGYSKNHKTRKFVENFTAKGMADYGDIDDFMQSIKIKIKTELHLDYVRPILLDDGKCKNAIFLLTKHRAGMLLMSKIAFKQSDDGLGINIKQQQSGQDDLFGTKGTYRHDVLAAKLEEKLKKQSTMTNDDIVDFIIQEEFLPKHAKDILKDLKGKNKIVVIDEHNNDITVKPAKWNIAEKISKSVTFTYVN